MTTLRLGHLAHGRLIQRWMSDPNEPGCEIGRIRLTWENLDTSLGWITKYEPMLLPENYRMWIKKTGLPDESDLHLHSASVYRQVKLKNFNTGTEWRGRTGPGVIFLDYLYRQRESRDPFISELTKAVYGREFHIDTLRYIYVTNIGNEDTHGYIEKHIYKPGSTVGDWGMSYPSVARTFEGLLGTEIGKIVSYLVLGAYGRGVKHITLIHVFRADNAYQLRFKIEDV